jgi:ATP-dependent exoDNAse (exonuclease V) beta subunit
MTAEPRPLGDQPARDRIRNETGSTLFVNAGAGSGKTNELVERVASLVLADHVRLAHIAAVTFTEKAGAELRDRLRGKFEKAGANDALDDLDGAAIGTLHSFAQRILGEHPIEAGLPPIIEVLDEVGSSVAFDERWAGLQSELLDDADIARALLVAMALGVELKQLRSLALLLGKDWDLLEERVLCGAEPVLSLPDLDGVIDAARRAVAMREHCTAADDKLLPKLEALDTHVMSYSEAADEESRLAVVKQIGELKFSLGQRGNWRCPVDDVRAAGNAVADRARTVVGIVLDSCLRILTRWIARQVVGAADVRRREGRLEFHDLLVMTRDLLRRNHEVRAAVHDDYQRVLLDEFQDTDPIQIELAVRICAGAAGGANDWRAVDVPAGRLFVVGDAKQSIYRFRRANIANYLDAQRHIGTPAELSTNFRTVEAVLAWINAVFGVLITATPGQQPPYLPLDAHRSGRGSGPPVVVLGAEPHPDAPRAAALREREAADVAAVVRQALDEGWTVFDERLKAWRPARHDDIAILVPARTSLPYLEDALDAAGVGYRAEASSLVYHAAEVRALLAAARAIADPSDALSLVTALRSTLFGCGDDDLWRWKHAGGSFSIYSEIGGPLADGPIGASLGYLRRVANAARWRAPSEVLAALVADRRMLEVAATGPRARDSWRRLRFVVDQARAWSEASPGGLRAYLAWAAHQGQEASRVAEAVLPETDADSVRVMTVHAAKGLEFPIVVLSGMTSQGNPGSGVAVLWPPEGGYAVKVRKSVQTDDFEAAVPIDEQMDESEKRRLLYVAATRARDHLVVSLHRGDGAKAVTAARLLAEAGGATTAQAVAFAGYEFDHAADGRAEVAAPPPFEQWRTAIEAARAATRKSPALSASGLEGTEPEVVLDAGYDPGRAKGPRNLELPPWSKGRYGSAVGRAVHAVLQAVDLATGAGLDDAVQAQVVAEGVLGHEQLVRDLVTSALAADVVQRAATREHWRETYAGAPRLDGVLVEGYLDLVYRDDDGALVVVDYKTDAVPSGALDSRAIYYKPQMDAYRESLRAATGAQVRATLLFLRPGGSVPVDV